MASDVTEFNPMKILSPVLTGLALSVLTTQVSAVVVSVDGSDVRFTYDNATLYGTGSVVGNAIVFTPSEFIAQSSNGGTVTATEMLNLQVEVLSSGTSLLGFQLLEQGDYLLSGAGATAEAGGVFEVSSNTNAYRIYDADLPNLLNVLTPANGPS